MTNPDWGNATIIREFILLGFGTSQELQILLFMVFLIIYTMTLVANLLIICLVVASQHLHNPMYFFLGNLSFLETCISSTILPRLLANFLAHNYQVSVGGCVVQLWAFACFAVTECYLLAAMSYDRYLAVCRPLHYNSLMNIKVCLRLAAGSWVSSFVQNAIFFSFMSKLTFCGENVIDHFFCDIIPILERACSDSQQIKLLSATLSFICTLPPFILNIASYGYIITAILEMSSSTGRKKAFSICSSHLVVVTIYYGSLIMVYILPKPDTLKELSKIFSVFYTVLTPLINPLIYSLRNKDVKEALRRTCSKCAFYVRVH